VNPRHSARDSLVNGPQIAALFVVLSIIPRMDDQSTLLISVALLSVYVIGVGGSTASALGIREAWRRSERGPADLLVGDVALMAPSLPRVLKVLRFAGWVAFPPALVLGVFANRHYTWVAPVTVGLMVALNAFYFSALQGVGERLTLTEDGFGFGKRRVKWIHVTELEAAHLGAFRGMKMSETGEWKDPRVHANVVLFRLNRALVRPEKSLLQRWSGLTYYDGVIRNVFGVSTNQLLKAMRERRRRAIEAEDSPLHRKVDAG
jgi:hypothetical protein